MRRLCRSIPVTSLLRPAILLLIAGHLFGCATLPERPAPSGGKTYGVLVEGSLPGRLAPLFVIEEPGEDYNLIGRPSARVKGKGGEELFVDPESPAFFVEERPFETANSRYRNLVYRIHFEKVPFGLFPFYLGTGRNVGLFVVVTLNERDEPILYTTVHTCGCYLAFIPTSYLPAQAFPAGWVKERQSVFGESLPGLLPFQGENAEAERVMLLIRSGSHRVKDVWVEREAGLEDGGIVPAKLVPMGELERLPLPGGGETSFFETSGSRKGYVKGSSKPWERLLMSWWAFDWRIGQDKKLGKDKVDGPLFYTSLKPWKREASDMRDFAAFLKFWGWGL